jgi:hypothetical protein
VEENKRPSSNNKYTKTIENKKEQEKNFRKIKIERKGAREGKGKKGEQIRTEQKWRAKIPISS